MLSTATAHRLGLTRSAVRHAIARRGWQRLVPGVVLTAAGPPTRADWIHVGMELTGRQGALSGWDAVRVMGIGSPRAPSEEVLVLDSPGRHRVAGLVRIRPTRRRYQSSPLPCEHPELAFVPIVSAARAVADTAFLYRTFAPVRALTTSAIQRRLCAPDELDAELRSGPRNHSALLRRALADVLDGAQSIAEAEAIDLLRTIGAPAFEVNVPIIDQNGKLLAVADLLWRAARRPRGGQPGIPLRRGRLEGHHPAAQRPDEPRPGPAALPAVGDPGSWGAVGAGCRCLAARPSCGAG
ncbi:MAG: hypothetical protein QOK11_1607 [Pseudonocardiales bacterium]|nr:hypothetical protein [Pseudonocardiales bacterium]